MRGALDPVLRPAAVHEGLDVVAHLDRVGPGPDDALTLPLPRGVDADLGAVGEVRGGVVQRGLLSAATDVAPADVFVKTPDLEGSQKGLGEKKRLRVID